MGAPVGNENWKGYRYRKALERALAHKYGSVDDGLFALAKVVVGKCEEGDAAMNREVADRFDGKPAQTIQGPEGGPVMVERIERVIVDHAADQNG